MIEKKNPNINKGAVFLSLIFALLFFLLVGRYFYLGWTGKAQGVDLQAYAEKVWTREKPLDAKRGTIYDQNGDVVAKDLPSYTVIAILDEKYKNHVKKEEIDEIAAKLAPHIEMSDSRIVELLSKDRVQVELGPGGNKISHSKMEEIKALKLSGIDFIRKTKRYYPNQNFASHILGFTVNNEKGTRTGAAGLERTLNNHLKEKDGKLMYRSDEAGYKLPDPKEVVIEPKHGSNVYLTIDEKIQLFLEQAMNQVDGEYNPKKMIGIVADPQTGRILAMSNRPSYNPNIRDIKNYTNYAIGQHFEPGSTMKIFTLAAAIEEGGYKGGESFKSGYYKTNSGETIGDHQTGGWGTITFDEGVRRSSNVAFMKIAKEQLGFDKLEEYLTKKWEFDQKTGIDIPGEVSSKIQYKWETEKLTTAFGQGTAITPIQQIQAATAIANGGKMMKPYVIEKIVNPTDKKTVQDHEPEVVGKPISTKTAKHVRELLRSVVTDGTGKNYNIEGYEVAGKTGTSEIPDPGKGYMKGWDNYIFSFMGMAPKDDPKLLVYVAIDRPNLNDKSYESGSIPVSRVFNSVMKNSLQHLNIDGEKTKTSGEKKPVGTKLKDFEDRSSKEVKKALEKEGLKVQVFGEGDTITDQAPYSGTTVLKGEKVFLKTEGNVKMPNLTGWSRTEVLRLARVLKLKTPEFTGNGYVTLQSISPGSTVHSGSVLVAELKPPQRQ